MFKVSDNFHRAVVWCRGGILAILATCLTGGLLAAEPSPISFDAQVADIFASRCLDCHQGSEAKGGLDLSRQAAVTKGGESGPALLGGQPENSLLWQRVTANEMPPKSALSAAEKELLRRWITEGAVWGTDPINRFRKSSATRAGYDWWSLKPLAVPELAETVASALTIPPDRIDHHIHTALRQHRLTASPLADRRTLIRRLSFDLLGLPPTPEQVTAFLNDPAVDAYERLVDEFLGSPHYGERWGRLWLDVARVGESQGFERDKLRENSWRYRDWVVQSLNDDLPYDEFARRQIAGDVLLPGDAAGVIATGFLVGGPYDEVGQTQQSPVMRAIVRQEELEDYVSATGQTFLGLTIHCARCHDHKFDPISQAEYYRLTAAFVGVSPGEKSVATPSITC